MASTLSIDLNARIAQFETEMKRATNTLDKFGKKGDETAALLRSTFKNLGGAFIGREILQFAKSGIDAAEALSELSDRSGISVKSLVGFQFAAVQTGASVEEYAKSLKFLNKNISEIASGDAPALKKLLEDLGLKDVASGSVKAEEALLRLAEVFPRLNDADRVRVALNLLGKSGESLVPALAGGRGELEKLISTGQKLNPITQEQAKQADNFNDAIGRLGISIRSILLPAFDVLLPGLESAAKRMAELTVEGHGFLAFMRGFAGIGKIPFDLLLPDTTAIKDASDEVARLQKAILETRRKIDTGKAPVPFLGEAVTFSEKSLATLRKNLREQEFILKNAQGRLKRVSDAAKPPSDAAKPIPLKLTNSEQLACEAKGDKWDGKKCTSAAAVNADDPTKKLLDNQLKSLEGSVTLEAALLGDRKNILDAYNSANLISLKDYFAGKKAAEEQALKNTLSSYDLEIVALQNFRSNTAKQTDKAEATGKINELVDKKTKLRQESALSSITNSFQETKAYEELQNSISNVNAQVLELTGNLHAAAVIRFDQQNKSLRDSFAANGNQDALDQLDALKKYSLAQADIGKLTADAGIINDQLANQETRINIARQSGAMGELGTLQQLSVARAAAVGKLEDVYQAQVKIARESGNPKLIQDAENFRVGIESLAATSDLVAQRIQTSFEDAAASAFLDFASGAKTAKDAFKDFARSVLIDIAKIQAKEWATSLFKGASGNSIGSAIGKLFGFAQGGIASHGKPVSLPQFSHGGVSKTAAIFGEAGPEAAVPLPDGRRIPVDLRGGGQTIIVNVNGGNNAPDVRRAAGQGAREALGLLSGAQRYA